MNTKIQNYTKTNISDLIVTTVGDSAFITVMGRKKRVTVTIGPRGKLRVGRIKKV